MIMILMTARRKKKKGKGPGTSWSVYEFKFELKELSTFLTGKVNMIRFTLRSKMMAKDQAAPEKEAMRTSLSTGQFGWKDWNTQGTVDFTSTQCQMDK
mmetsp:Transcript_20021/g.45358  ORF Transcript_20021/g.45358 Transcript_20021/m.45358 type:complete len:98 (+) Transcript_20021:105-398(+)